MSSIEPCGKQDNPKCSIGCKYCISVGKLLCSCEPIFGRDGWLSSWCLLWLSWPYHVDGGELMITCPRRRWLLWIQHVFELSGTQYQLFCMNETEYVTKLMATCRVLQMNFNDMGGKRSYIKDFSSLRPSVITKRIVILLMVTTTYSGVMWTTEVNLFLLLAQETAKHHLWMYHIMETVFLLTTWICAAKERYKSIYQ